MGDVLLTFGLRWAESTWALVVDSALLFLVGLVLAGVVSLWLNQRTIARLVNGSPRRSVFMATLVGIPLPLCSCSVLPVASQLRRAGLGKGGTMAFLIATPETGVDSILLTYTLTDPLLTVARPISAFLTAATAGMTEAAMDRETEIVPAGDQLPQASCGCHDGCCAEEIQTKANGGWFRRTVGQMRDTVTDLVSDLAPYLFVGFLLAGLVSALVNANPSDIPSVLKSGWAGYVGAMLVGLPLYVCATSSTPLAAVLLGAGFSPGAILVFLLVGPATNVATILVVKRLLGWASTVRYIVIIAATAVLSGIVVDAIYRLSGITASYRPGEGAERFGVASYISAILLTATIAIYSYRWLVKKFPAFSLKRLSSVH